MKQHFDLIVVGLGAMGGATLYQASKMGAKVLGIDRFDPPHTFGSTHAETRVTRLAVGEGLAYVPFVKRSHEIWRELETITGQGLLYQPGLYIIAPNDATQTAGGHWDQFVDRTAVIAQQANVPFEIRTPAAVRAHQPTIVVDENSRIGFEPTGGVVLCEQALSLQLQQAKRHDATIRTNEPVRKLTFSTNAVTVTTDQGNYTADKVVVAAGAWMADFMPPIHRPRLTVTRQIVYWFEVEDPARFAIDHFPAIIWQGQEIADYAGIFPIPKNGYPGIKLLTEQFIETTDPRTVSRTVTQAEMEHYYHAIIASKIAGITPNCLKAEVCLYTNTPDDHFIVDRHPDSDRVLLASPCSGHGFKHSAGLGEGMAEFSLTGQSRLNLSHFRLARFK